MPKSDAKRKRSVEDDSANSSTQSNTSHKLVPPTSKKVRFEEPALRTRDIRKHKLQLSVERVVNECFKAYQAWLARSQKPTPEDHAVDQYRIRIKKVMAKVNTLEHISLLGNVLVTLASQRDQVAIVDALSKLPPYKIRSALDSSHSDLSFQDAEHVWEPANLITLECKLRKVVADSQRCSDFLQPLGLSLNSTNMDTTAYIDSVATKIARKKLDELSEMKLSQYQKGLAARREDHLKELIEHRLEYEKKLFNVMEEYKKELIAQREDYEKKLGQQREEHRQDLRNVRTGHKDDIDTHIQARNDAEERERAHHQRADVAEQQERELRREKEGIEHQFQLLKEEIERQQKRLADDERIQRELHRKETERGKLRKLSKTNKLALQALVNLVSTNTVTQAKLEELKVPEKESCLLTLRDLWRVNSNIITKITPHDLLNDLDMLLIFDARVIAQARCAMYMVQCWGHTPQELLATEWDLRAMNRLQSGLVPHEDQEPLSSLKQDVDYICLVLREATEQIQAPQAIHPFNASLASYTSTQYPSVFDSSFSSSNSSNTMISTSGGAFGQPMTTGPWGVTANQLADDRGPEPMEGIEQHGLFITCPQPYNQKTQECHKFEKNKCHKGAKECRFRHPMCAHFSRGSCKWGDECRWSHDPCILHSEFGINTAFDPQGTLHKRNIPNPFKPAPPQTMNSINYFQTASTKDKVCSKFLQNKCRKGTSCTHQHPQLRIPCPRYARNECTLGPSCKMMHDPTQHRLPPPPPPHTKFAHSSSHHTTSKEAH